MKGVGSPKLLFENLDLTPIYPILWKDLHRDGPGRPVEYQPEWDLWALMLRQLEQIPYVKDLVKRLRRNPYLRKVCGYRDRAPSSARRLFSSQSASYSSIVARSEAMWITLFPLVCSGSKSLVSRKSSST